MIKNDKYLKEHFLREYNNSLIFFNQNNKNVRQFSKIITTTHEICDKLFDILLFKYVFDFQYYINSYSSMIYSPDNTISFILKFQLNEKINDLLLVEIKYTYDNRLMSMNSSDIEIEKFEITNISHTMIKDYNTTTVMCFKDISQLDV